MDLISKIISLICLLYTILIHLIFVYDMYKYKTILKNKIPIDLRVGIGFNLAVSFLTISYQILNIIAPPGFIYLPILLIITFISQVAIFTMATDLFTPPKVIDMY